MSHSNHQDHIPQHGSSKNYIIGFILSVVLTLIPFLMVMNQSADRTTLFAVIVITAVLQLLVQLVCFLHLGSNPEERWNLISFIFTAIVIVLLVGLSIWIMWSLNANMVLG
ncbi:MULTISPECIES: cytochrome o ubiquinol oxidase subunit IV [Snodgrassella]|jgi:cytochrome o ubiquinol oxidase subunit IV|uniref:Cytochrome bo(3) ubiquinol oxidase subunit 4 n=1 Tax=Snodgrassella alvi TaxID=1196083 RepID=A0A2N9XZU9_9NEIS|nr:MULTISPECIES: cytochrome o ubiquinol oxidase subunit IV [Snodgrassella]NUE65662.1 cytochrome o ubiquinol oxidase subunit IV [Snodgrassella sp. ESL0253]PIT12531.1 cytochrome o ubiquinol oxidase subunit IV [Snodgrassella alvi]PIT13822.1 cytochrome o ubiquinol oxidase subunit IV [Snodgrassella alvi]PIT17051.1 cytochrome o ubiquinol oxidase subunit IV [Snodgrassella alvi]PIT57447.1 cytochrome o ubiquinol oxidase subunit IV [Snodgrassella alvi]